jgi:hypothetical protein
MKTENEFKTIKVPTEVFLPLSFVPLSYRSKITGNPGEYFSWDLFENK